MIHVLLYLCFMLYLEESPKKTVTKNGMKVSWRIKGARIYFEMDAPTYGWVAIGLHTKDQLVGNNLIMGAVVDGTLKLEDQYIQSIGAHPTVKQLGGKDLLRDGVGKETTKHTSIGFSLPLQPNDQYHLDLEENKTYYLLMAYSTEDDFQHHSRMRTTISITL